MTTEYQPRGLELWDIVVVVLYLVVIIAIGIYVGASVFASNIGSEHFIGMAGSGAAGGIGVAAYNTSANILLPFLGFIVVPVYIAGGISTVPEYIHRRYGGQRIRVWLSTLSMFLYVFTKISVNLYAGALFVRLALGWDLYFAILLMLFITFLCTITGGLTAVIYTDTLCTILMVVGSLIVMAMGFSEVGGYSGLKEKYMRAVSNDTLYSNSTCGRPRQDAFVMLRDPLSDVPWPGLIFGQTFSSIWYWCADQVIVQRVLAAKSLSHAQGGCIFAAYIKILPLFTLVIPGMISRVLSPDRVACSVPEKCLEICGSEAGCSNIAYPELVIKIMPTGLRGLMMAVMMAALMSDLTSIFNSASTLFTIDIYSVIRKRATVRELMIVGRITVAIITGISILWIPVIQELQGGQLFLYIQAVAAYFAPPISCLYLISILWTKATEKGAFWGLMVGFLVGAIRMVLDFTYGKVPCGKPDPRPAVVKLHFTYFALVLFVLTGIISIVISLLTKPRKGAEISRLTWWTRHDSGNEYVLPSEKAEEIGLDLKLSHNNESSRADEEKPIEIDIGRPSRFSIIVGWFCGYEESSEKAIQAQQEQKQRMAVLTSLKQDPKAKAFLYVNVVICIIIGIALYIYFSV